MHKAKWSIILLARFASPRYFRATWIVARESCLHSREIQFLASRKLLQQQGGASLVLACCSLGIYDISFSSKWTRALLFSRGSPRPSLSAAHYRSLLLKEAPALYTYTYIYIYIYTCAVIRASKKISIAPRARSRFLSRLPFFRRASALVFVLLERVASTTQGFASCSSGTTFLSRASTWVCKCVRVGR